jgi:CubicO group peptidase (beta-lactamase class C family)
MGPGGARATSLLAALAAITPPSDVEIRKVLAERVEALAAHEPVLGIVVGVVGPEGRRVVAYGHPGQGHSRPLDGETAFEIGSVTKVFTALLLAEMVESGDVALTDPVAKHLPAARIPRRNGRSITLADLATHTSALPFMPDALPDFSAPAATKYGAAQLYEFLARYELPCEIGTRWEYSNIGYWLLGEALAARAGTDFESLLRRRVLAPLGLHGTAVTPGPGLKATLAAGHNAVLQPVPSLSTVPVLGGMPAAGGLVSTARDMSAFLAATMGYEGSPCAAAMSALLSTRRPTAQPGVEQALGWTVVGGDDPLIIHDGGTLGFASSLAWDPKRRIGVVVLSNHVADVGDIARHLLRPEYPLKTPTAARRVEIALDPALLDTYAGRYDAAGEGVFAVVRQGDFLAIELPADWGLPKLRLRPESAREFFVAELPLRVAFQSDGKGRVTSLLVHPPRGQKAVLATRR